MKNQYKRYTKIKIIIGYTSIILIAIISAKMIYRQAEYLVVDRTDNYVYQQKMNLIGNTLTDLYEAETLSNAFIQSGMSKYFRKYINIQEITDNRIEKLKQITENKEQLNRLDSINLLLEEKMEKLQELVYIKKTFVPEDFYHEAIANIQSDKNEINDIMDIRPRYITSWDTSYIKIEKKKKRRNRQYDSIPNIIKKYEIVYDTIDLAYQREFSNKDSVVNILKNTWEDVRKKEQDISKEINKQETEIINQSTEVSEKLKSIIREYEKEEYEDIINTQHGRESTLKKMAKIFSIMTAITILIILLFIYTILKDISRNNIYRKELETANKYTEELLSKKEKLIQTITHDIKAPLGSIMGYIELIDNAEITKKQHYFLNNMKNSAEHILKLATNLLDWSKLENNKLKLEKVCFNPYQLINEIVDNFIPQILKKNLIIIKDIDEQLNREDSFGDALRIREVITNLLSNAVKYTDKGTINVEAYKYTDEGKICVKIRDTGCGISEEDKSRIFEEFTRLSAHNVEGTGLGLTITLKLIQLLDGKLKVESKTGEGSCFTVIIPLEKVKNKECSKPEICNGKIENLNVLVVDDDDLQLAMTSGMLTRYNIKNTSIIHPENVIELLEREKYDIVFTDIQMPGLNGFDLIGRIRKSKDEKIKNIPVVALSADANTSHNEYMKAGFTNYLSKPFRSVELIQIIENITKYKISSIEDCTMKIHANKEYTLKNIIQYADNDEETLNKIMHSFIKSTHENIESLKRFLTDKNVKEIARLAHKMLPIFKQLENQQIIDMLQQLESSQKVEMDENKVCEMTIMANEKIETLIKSIEQELQ